MAAGKGNGLVLLLLANAALVVGVAAISMVAGGAAVAGNLDFMKLLRRVSGHEGTYGSMNRNRDGAGLSYGILQWTQKSGNLGKLLRAMYRAEPLTFVKIFGGVDMARELLEHTEAGRMTALGTAVLWNEPWVSMFRAAGQVPQFQAVQREQAQRGEHWTGAVRVAKEMDLITERSLALYFDTAVQQGAGAAMTIARQVKKLYYRDNRWTISNMDVLRAFAQTAANRSRSLTPPSTAPRSGLEWRKVGDEWHLFAVPMGVDLYRNVLSRRMGIINDSKLADTHVVLA